MTYPGEGSKIDKLFYSLGFALEEARSFIDEAMPGAEAAAEREYDPGVTDRRATDGASAAGSTAHATGTAEPSTGSPSRAHASFDLSPELGEVAATVATAAAGWLVARLLRPRPVRWTRAIAAGIAATTLAELAATIETRECEPRPVFPPRPEDLPRLAAGIVTAAAYASVFYPRLPGSPLKRGLAFVAADRALRRSGGLIGLLQRIAPDAELPLHGFLAPALPRSGPLAGLGYALGLALYRNRR